MSLREPAHLPTHVRQRLGEVVEALAVELGKLTVEVEGLVEVLKNAAIVDNVAEVLAIEEAVHARDRLQQGVALQMAGEVEHGVPWCIEAGQQLVHHDDDLGRIGMLEGADDLAVVLLLPTILRHHPLPEGLDLILRRLVDVLLALAVVGTGDQHFARHHVEFAEEPFVEEGRRLVLGDELGLVGRALPVVPKVIAHIPGDPHDLLFRFVQLIARGKLPLQVVLLLIGERRGDSFEPVVHRLGVHLLVDVTPLVEKRHHSFVLHGLLNRIRVNQTAEALDRVLVLLRHRRAGKANEAGIRQCLPHLRMKLAVLAPVTLVH